ADDLMIENISDHVGIRTGVPLRTGRQLGPTNAFQAHERQGHDKKSDAFHEPRGSWAGVPPAAGASRPRTRRGRDAREDSRDGCPTYCLVPVHGPNARILWRWGLSMNRSAEIQLGGVWLAPRASLRPSALQARSSWAA